MQRSESRAVLYELLAMTLLFLSYIWLWQGSFPQHRAAFIVLFLGLGAASHLRRGETIWDIGIRLENFVPAARAALPFVAPLALVPILIGAAMGTVNLEAFREVPGRLPWKAMYATAQEYGLLAFYFRRFSEVLPGTRMPTLAAAGIFAVYHLPNPFLTVVTLATGSLACWLYRRTPNLLVLGLLHALGSYAISCSLPPTVTFGMRVGPGFFRIWNELHGGL